MVRAFEGLNEIERRNEENLYTMSAQKKMQEDRRKKEKAN